MISTFMVLFERNRQAYLTVGRTKWLIGYGNYGNSILSRIRDAQQPGTNKLIRSFLGLLGYYKFISAFKEVVSPLTYLTEKGCPNKVVWEEKHTKALKFEGPDHQGTTLSLILI
ncbi:hypothetical protein MAR_020443 [Mya arenaria]|uniref:Uncharacterized protein n=1 Tax=Mya arenaria TaxID=6604 RepID=A0ABY7E9J3_MYAAR|nr:hypothetical protein MAR_020443 [Mya arenaria]